LGNDLRRVGKVVESAEGVGADSLQAAGNLDPKSR
jgi:hypothetical protein